jgi:uncharacterized protein GlcG (DUF336 family)
MPRWAGETASNISGDGSAPQVLASLTSAQAQTWIEKAQQKAKQMNLRVSLYVVDASGIPVAFVRMDGADISTPDIARAKAYTAVAFGKHSGDLVEEMKGSPLDANGLMQVGQGKIVFIAGGVLAKKDGAVLGAIGVSGAEADEDHECGLAAIS